MTPHTSKAGQRVWSMLPDGTRDLLGRRLAPTDLQTALLDVAGDRAGAVTPVRVLQRWQQDRFVRPSAQDPRAHARLVARLWDLLPDRFAGVELSPVTPLGTCAAVAGTSQNRVLSTVRGTEVVSDPTNALAVEAAARVRTAGDATGRVDLAAHHRVLRTQAVDGPGLFAHFPLFALVSTARDRGSGRAEAEMLTDHLRYWRTVFETLLPQVPARLTFTTFRRTALTERIEDTVRPALAGSATVRLVEDRQRIQGDGYYAGTAIGLAAAGSDLGDGGFTTWTADLLGDAKQRCLTSCVSTERLAALLPG